MLMNIEQPTKSTMPPILMLGFRPFFLASGIFSVVMMLLWMAVFSFGQVALYPSWVANMTWHAHEMMFGYTFAVIAGFLLTAVKNWTGISPASGAKLALIFGIWLLARLLPYFDAVPLVVIAIVDSVFMFWVALLILIPLYKVKQFKQYGIVAKLILLGLSNVVFYLGVMDVLSNGIHWGLYSALYIILGLVFVMVRRLVPFFIEKGLRVTKPVPNNQFLDYSSLVLFAGYWIFDVFVVQEIVLLILSVALFIVHSIRLVMWYQHGVWGKSLLWVLVVAYFMLTAGFALKALSIAFNISPYLAIHAFAVGGVGILTLGMMSRVSLGHTGRDIFNPPKILNFIFIVLTLSAVLRVFMPIIIPASYPMLIILSQGLWATAFAVFVYIYSSYFIKKRIDGHFG